MGIAYIMFKLSWIFLILLIIYILFRFLLRGIGVKRDSFEPITMRYPGNAPGSRSPKPRILLLN